MQIIQVHTCIMQAILMEYRFFSEQAEAEVI